MLDFYEKQGFKLFPCSVSKAPAIPRKTDWKDDLNHLSLEQAEQRMATGQLIGAWIPKDYVVVDIDINHVDKLGNPKTDGLEEFLKLADESFLKETLVVKTGSGGYHLYYKNASDITVGKLTDSVDIKTYSGYVIAAGSPGYSVHSYNEVADFPDLYREVLKDKLDKRASKIVLKNPLSPKLLKKVLGKLSHKSFNTNDSWLELMMACIATAGNNEAIIDVLENWSKGDPAFENDTTVRTRIESLSPSGGITPATFLFILRREGISEYMILQVRKEIGAFLNITGNIKDEYVIPFKLNLEKIADLQIIANAFFYHKDQANTSRLFVELTKDFLMYSKGEKQFYYFHRNRWQPIQGVLNLIYAVLVRAADEYYLQYAVNEGKDADDALGAILSTLGSATWRQKILLEISQADDLVINSPAWDSPKIAETLTLRDGVVDFTGTDIKYREGTQEEFRKSYIDLSVEEFREAGSPERFKKFITDIFPDKDTRKLAVWALSIMVSGTGKFRKFQIWNGAGKNGKSTLKEIMQEVIGDKAISFKASILLQKSGGFDSNLTPDLATFQGAIAAFASETEEGKKISQGIVKNMTGDEKITANPKYRDPITFETTFQLVLTTNYLPSFSAHDGAFLDRLLILPFYTRFYSNEEDKQKWEENSKYYVRPAKDPKQLKREVLEERAAILKLLVTRYLRREQMPKSQESTKLLNSYITENDLFGNFINHYLEIGDSDYFVPTRELTELFNTEYNTKYSSTFIVRRLKEAYQEIETGRGKKDGAWHRGLMGVRIKDQKVDF